MLKQRWGRIVNITSIFGQTGQAGKPTTPPPKPDSSASPWPWPRSRQPQHHRQRRRSRFIETSMTAL